MLSGINPGDQPVDNSRRRLLHIMTGCAVGTFAAPVLAKLPTEQERHLSFYNTHTGESLRTVYRANGTYLPEGLLEINHILRDFRTDQDSSIDPQLLDLLYTVRSQLDSNQPFNIISGYRSPATNAKLRAKSGGVAKRSLHMDGKAIDVRLPKVELTRLRQAALDLKRGGVGYYPKSDFVHIDTGRVRHW